MSGCEARPAGEGQGGVRARTLLAALSLALVALPVVRVVAEPFQIDLDREALLRQLERGVVGDLVVGDVARIRPGALCQRDRGLYARDDAELLTQSDSGIVIFVRRQPGGSLSAEMFRGTWEELDGENRHAVEAASLRLLFLEFTPQPCAAVTGEFEGSPDLIEIGDFHGVGSLSEAIAKGGPAE